MVLSPGPGRPAALHRGDIKAACPSITCCFFSIPPSNILSLFSHTLSHTLTQAVPAPKWMVTINTRRSQCTHSLPTPEHLSFLEPDWSSLVTTSQLSCPGHYSCDNPMPLQSTLDLAQLVLPTMSRFLLPPPFLAWCWTGGGWGERVTTTLAHNDTKSLSHKIWQRLSLSITEHYLKWDQVDSHAAILGGSSKKCQFWVLWNISISRPTQCLPSPLSMPSCAIPV